jgi:hypothetical protein
MEVSIQRLTSHGKLNRTSILASKKPLGQESDTEPLEDIFGCMFFYIKDQLREFLRRIQTHKISFHLFNLDARNLPKELSRLSLGSFDRVEVSNITDHTYVGTQTILRDWSPMLSRQNTHATIIGLYMNWVMKTPEGRAATGAENMNSLLRKYEERFPVSSPG